MDRVVYDRIEDVLGRIESLYGRVEDTYLVAKDILLGTQISDWIADLKASGTASATYSDATRMNALIANEDAANNSDVAKYLVQWAVANNKYGTYCGAACGAVSGVTWDSLTTPNAVMGNATAFTALCGNAVAFDEAMQNASCKNAIWNCSSVTEQVFRTNAQARTRLNQYSSDSSLGGDYSANMFIFTVQRYDNASINVTLYYKNGGSETFNTGSGLKTINKFVTRFVSDSSRYPNVRYVDFN